MIMSGFRLLNRRDEEGRERARIPAALAQCLRTVAGLASLLLIGIQTDISFGAQEVDEKGRKVIRQGGYVEYVDPNVDYEERMPRIPPREPAESLKAFRLIEGFRLDLVAAEPLVRDAVDLTFDENGRLFVVEMITYSEAGETRQGRVSRLEDVDGDGRFDKSTVYVDGLMWPTGVTCFDGGIFITTAPDILYCKDTDGDGKADFQEVVVSGFETTNPNAFPNSLRWGLDGRIHGMSSTAGGMLRAVKWERGGPGRRTDAVQCRGRDFSFHPRTGELRLESGGSQFGMTYDEWERKFECSNSAPIEMVTYEERYLARNPYLVAPSSRLAIRVGKDEVFRTSQVEPWRIIRTEMRIGKVFSGPVEGGGSPAGYFTAASGVMIYTGNAWPEQFRGNAFVCEGAGNLVHRMRLDPKGVVFEAHRTEENREFLTSTEVWFRPIHFANAPDGTLYLADMYREVYEHPDAIPPSVRKFLDINAGNDRGRVYRILPEGFRQPPPVRLRSKPSTELVRMLEHSNGWHRRTASRLLYERQDQQAIEPMAKLASESSSPLGRMHALNTLSAQDGLTPEIVLARLDDSHPRVREHAVRLAEKVLGDSPEVRAKLNSMVSDKDLRVRYQLAFTIGDIPGAGATAALSEIALGAVEDRWIRLALLSSSLGRVGDLFSSLAGNATWRTTKDGQAFLAQLAEQAGLQGRNDQIAAVFKSLESFTPADESLTRDVVRDLSKGLKKSGSPLQDRLATGDTARVLADLVEQSKIEAGDLQQPADRRVEAIRSLALSSFDEVGNTLCDLLHSRQPSAVQAAAIQTLGRFLDTAVPAMIIKAWSGFSPQVRSEAIEVLFSRRGRLPAFLDAIEAEQIIAGELDPARIHMLTQHADTEIAKRASELLGKVQFGERQAVVDANQDVLRMKGDSGKGRETFRTLCSTCHRLEGFGYDLGIPLGSVKNRGQETILLNILDPNREVNPQYINFTISTKDDEMITGIITAETATSITLHRGENASDTVLRTDIDFFRNSGISIMPEGLEQGLSKQDMADLLAYLMEVK